jgi:tetratricopeptide (TPR) repeat protein
MTTTERSGVQDLKADGRKAVKTPRRGRGKAWLLLALVLLAFAMGIQDLKHLPWYQEWRLARMSLADLQRERGTRLDDPRLLYYTGLRLNQIGRYSEADPLLRNAVGLDPESPRLRDEWANALVRTGLITAAFGELRQYAGTHPNSPQAHLLLGKFYMTQSSYLRATEELTTAVKLDPNLGEGWSYLAAAESGLNSLADAEQAARRAVALRPNSASDRLGLALLLLGNGKTAEARTVFLDALHLAPNSAAIHREYARCLLSIGAASEVKAAEAEAQRAIALDPNDVLAQWIRGQALIAGGRPGEAVPCLEAAARQSPYAPGPAFTLAQAYRRLHQREQAIAWDAIYRRRNARMLLKQETVTAIQKSPHDPAPQQSMARLLAEEGDVSGCLRHNAEALHCAPDAPPALVAAAIQLTAVGRAADALPLTTRAVTLARNNPLAYEAKGDALVALGQPQEAARAYARAVKGFPDRLDRYQARLDAYARRHGYRGPSTPTQPLPHTPTAPDGSGKADAGHDAKQRN